MSYNEFLDEKESSQQIKILVDQTLHNYFKEGMLRDHIDGDPQQELIAFLADVLNDTSYPIEAHLTTTGEIRLSYQPRAFADPIF
ncbi:MAG: hypothetical protein KAT93_07935 [Desulfuromonadales bacterium]|jgi:hypothetical protein|nr:hypothetical protein [Desulfuromonadales bacterium]